MPTHPQDSHAPSSPALQTSAAPTTYLYATLTRQAYKSLLKFPKRLIRLHSPLVKFHSQAWSQPLEVGCCSAGLRLWKGGWGGAVAVSKRISGLRLVRPPNLIQPRRRNREDVFSGPGDFLRWVR